MTTRGVVLRATPARRLFRHADSERDCVTTAQRGLQPRQKLLQLGRACVRTAGFGTESSIDVSSPGCRPLPVPTTGWVLSFGLPSRAAGEDWVPPVSVGG